jgi:pyruvate dehydrogenase E1 component alpha subunit
VDGQDVRAVYSVMARLVARARQGEGPAFLVCHTYRFRGHHVGDIDRSYYRSKEEEEWWRSRRDPLNVLGGWLTGEQAVDPGILARIDETVRGQVEAAVAFALEAPYPDPSEVERHVYA